MNEKHAGTQRGFVHFKEAWYAFTGMPGGIIDDVMFGFYAPDGGTTGEMRLAWHDLGREVAPRLEVFDDAWDALFQCQDVLTALAERDGQNMTPANFCALLTTLGFADLTQRQSPYQAAPAEPGEDKFEIAAAAIKGGSQRAFDHLLDWLMSADLDDRDHAGRTLAQLAVTGVLDDVQRRTIRALIANLKSEALSPNIRRLAQMVGVQS